MTRKTCTWNTLNPDESCDMPSVTRDLCRKHYDRARVEKILEMVGTGPKGGRPTGPKLASPLADVRDDPEPSWQELKATAKKVMMRLLTDESAAMQERNLAIKLAVTVEEAGDDEEQKKAFQEMIAQARGLRAVDE